MAAVVPKRRGDLQMQIIRKKKTQIRRAPTTKNVSSVVLYYKG